MYHPLILAAGAIAAAYFAKKHGTPCTNCGSNNSTTTQQNSSIGNNLLGGNFWDSFSIGESLGASSGGGGFTVSGGSSGTTSGGTTSGGTTSGGTTSGGTTSGGTTSGGGGGGTTPGNCFTNNLKFKTPLGYRTFGAAFLLGPNCVVVNKTGEHKAYITKHNHYTGTIIVYADGYQGGITPNHPMGIHGKKTAGEMYKDRPTYTMVDGDVYDITIETIDENSKHVILENGDIAHNKPIGGG